MALELDPENNLMTDSIYTYDRDLHGEHNDSNNDIMNKLYLLDGHEDVHHIVQERGQQGHHKYTVVDKRSVSQWKNIQSQITEFKSETFNTLSITRRCMTINEVNYNFSNQRYWDLDIRTREMRGKELIEKDDDQSETSEDEVQNTEEENKLHYKVHWVRNIPWTQRMLISVSIQDKD